MFEVHHEFRKLNEIETHLLSWGNIYDENARDVILCITGNPGLPEFYEEFGKVLHANVNLPVCVIGQAGHEQMADEKSNMLKGQQQKFDLQGQISHKIDLIDSFHKNSRLHLIGHSIGAWMVVEILNRQENILARTASVQLLFPTLQKMIDTRNGFFLDKILRNIHTIALAFITLVFALPEMVKMFLINLFLKIQGHPPRYGPVILKYINPLVMEKVLFLAYDEMDKVVELNRSGIDKIKHMTNVIYSDNDGWAPVHLIDDLKEFEPPIQRQMVSYHHAFVLRSSENVAEMAEKFIRTKLPV